jgi:hypothetical protein
MNEKIKNVAWLAAPCAAIGGFLFNQGYRRSGWTLVGVAAMVVLLGFLSFVVPWLGRVFFYVARPIRALVGTVRKLLWHGYMWLVRKLIVPALAVSPDMDSQLRLSWTASEQKAFLEGGQRADYLKLEAEPNYRLRGLEFSVRPDYQFSYWRAGFRLGPTSERLEEVSITNGFLFHIYCDGGGQPGMVTYCSGQSWPTSLPQYAGETRTPVFVVRANLWRVPNSTRVRVSVSVNDVVAQAEPELDVSLTGRLLLLAWADGRQFHAHFDGINAYWAPNND